MSSILRLSALALAATLTVAACSSDDDADSTTTAAAAAATAEAATTTEAAATTAPAETTTTAAAETTTTVAAGETIIDVLTAAGNYTVLLGALEATGLIEELTARERTLLAPTDEAFESADPALIGPALEDPDALRAVLLDHVLPIPQTAAQIAIFNNVLTLGGASFTVATNNGDLFIGDALVVEPDLEASNGYVQGINRVLLRAG